MLDFAKASYCQVQNDLLVTKIPERLLVGISGAEGNVQVGLYMSKKPNVDTELNCTTHLSQMIFDLPSNALLILHFFRIYMMDLCGVFRHDEAYESNFYMFSSRSYF